MMSILSALNLLKGDRRIAKNGEVETNTVASMIVVL
jgi:hypothetical protein